MLTVEAGTQAAVVQNHAQVAVDVIQVVAVEAAAELRFAHPPADDCIGIKCAAYALADRHQVFQRGQVGNVDFQVAADGSLHDGMAELLADADVAANVAVARFTVDLIIDATVLETGLQGQAVQPQGLFAVGQDDVAALLAHVEEAACVLAVRQIPVGGQYQIVFYGHFEEALQFGHVQIGRRPFAGQAVFLVPHEAVQIQTAAHRRPLCRAQGHAFRTCFQAHAVLQFQVEAAAQVQPADCALPAVFFVQPAVGFQIEFVVFAAHRHAAAAADAVAHAGA